MKNGRISLEVSADDEDVAYLFLPDHPGKGSTGCIKRQIRLSELINNYNGPDVFLDFGDSDNLIGIEILS